MRGAEPPDEFETILRLFAPLAGLEGLGLLDDAAVLPSRPGQDLVLTKDAMVEGVHFLPDDPLDLVARKLLRVNLSDLAAKGAEPAGYLLACAWSPRCGWAERAAFAQGLAVDQAAFGLSLLGGDTVATPGPLTLSATLLGWTPAGGMVRRSGAQVGDRLLVSGTIGDGGLGLAAAQGGLTELAPGLRNALATRYRLPEPRLTLREALRTHATAAADVSDGLLADAGRIGLASGVGVTVALDRLPLSPAAAAWLAGQPDRTAALLRLATGGDDYEVVCTAPHEAVSALQAVASAMGTPLAAVGEVVAEEGVAATLDGKAVKLDRLGWRHD